MTDDRPKIARDDMFPGDIATMFPRSRETMEKIADSARRVGIREPVTVFPDGEIIDGATRWHVACAIGCSLPYKVFLGSREEAVNLAVRANAERRQLTTSQRACVAARLCQGDACLTSVDAARVMSVSKRMVTYANWILANEPEHFDALVEGKHHDTNSVAKLYHILAGKATGYNAPYRKVKAAGTLANTLGEFVSPETAERLRTAEMDEETARAALEEVKALALSERVEEAQKAGVATSVLYDVEGNPKIGWVKTRGDKEKQVENLAEFIDALKADIEPITVPIPRPEHADEVVLKSMNQFTITDYHIGMLAWSEETRGDDWDSDIAADLLERWIMEAVRTAPPAHTAVLAQLGDFAHWDGLDSVTPLSRHVLDSDSRYRKMTRLASGLMRKMIETLLQTHERVHVIMAEGNHDLTTAGQIADTLDLLYANEARVSIDTSVDPYYCFRWGKTALFYHHGHLSKQKGNLDRVFAAKFPQLYGETEYRYGHCGHYHHQVVQESALMTIEQHRTLAANDAYASRGGWISGRDAKVITYHEDYGEVRRITINPAILNAK